MHASEIHEAVSQAYTDKLKRSKAGDASCCGGGCCGPEEGAAADPTVGYGAETERFSEAAVSSFGCGNPVALAGIQPGQTVLDLGSGAGFDLLLAAERVGPTGKVIGVDMTDAMLEAARRNIDRYGLGQIVEVRKGLIEDLPVESGSVDWVISNCVINLSPEKPKVFAELARVLKPGGWISVSDIVAESLPDFVRQSAAAYAACVAGAISEGEYLDGLRGAGLTEVAVVDRYVYDADAIRAMVAAEVPNLEVPQALLEVGIAAVAGKVWSARFTGRRADER